MCGRCVQTCSWEVKDSKGRGGFVGPGVLLIASGVHPVKFTGRLLTPTSLVISSKSNRLHDIFSGKWIGMLRLGRNCLRKCCCSQAPRTGFARWGKSTCDHVLAQAHPSRSIFPVQRRLPVINGRGPGTALRSSAELVEHGVCSALRGSAAKRGVASRSADLVLPSQRPFER